MLSTAEDMLSRKSNGSVVGKSTNHAFIYTSAPGASEKIGGHLPDLLEINVIDNEQAFDELEDEWNQLLERADTHVFQSFEWQRTWWKYFGGNGRLHILAFRDEERLVGIAPFYISEVQLYGLYTYRHLQFLAGCLPAGDASDTFSKYSLSDYLDLIADPEYREKIAETLMSYLAEQRNFFDQISLDELPEDGVMMEHLVPKLEEAGWPCIKEKAEVCPQIELPATMDEYLYKIRSSVRYDLRRSIRSVTEDNLYNIHTIRAEEDLETVFRHLVDLHQARWNSQGYPGVFTDARVEQFLKTVSIAFMKRNWLNLKSSFDHDGNCLAVNLTFAFKQRIYDYQRAFDITSDLARYGPGNALIYYLVEEAIDEGKEIFDLLRGDEKYKLRIATRVRQNWKVSIHNLAHEKGFIYRLNRFASGVSDFMFRVRREFLLLHIHIREHGIADFMPAYRAFIKKRLNKNTNG